jgi:hypothetical protein
MLILIIALFDTLEANPYAADLVDDHEVVRLGLKALPAPHKRTRKPNDPA